MTGFCGHIFWDGASAPTDGLRGTAEFPTAGVGLCEVPHPGHRGGVSANGGRAAGHITPGPLSVDHIPDTREGYHRYDSQEGWDHSPQSYSDRRGQLGGALCHHRIPHCSAM